VPEVARPPRSAQEIFDEIGPWAGDDAEEIAEMLMRERRTRGNRRVPEL